MSFEADGLAAAAEMTEHFGDIPGQQFASAFSVRGNDRLWHFSEVRQCPLFPPVLGVERT